MFCGTATIFTVTGAGGDVRHKPPGSGHLRPLTSPSCVPRGSGGLRGLVRGPEEVVKCIAVRLKKIDF